MFSLDGRLTVKARFLLAALLSALCILAVAGLSGQARGQKGRARAAPAKAPKIVTRAVTVSAALRQALANKRRFNAKGLEAVLTYSASKVPRLKLRGGKQVLLEKVTAEPAVPASARVTSSKLATQLKKYQPYITQATVGKAQVTATLVATGVDHHSNQTAVRDQADRNTCVSFAAMAAIEAIYKKRDGVTKNLSENHAHNIFMQKEGSTCTANHGLQTWKAAGYLTTDRVCEESQSPYVTTPSSSCATIQSACQNNRDHGHLTYSTFFSPEFGGSGTNIATNTNYLESLLDAGNDVVMGVYVAGGDWFDGSAESGVVDVEITGSGDPSAPYGGHAMLMIGYSKAGDYFIFKNSWGSAVGHSGYFHLTYEYLQTYAKYGYVVHTATSL
jgi:hypothetical protein